MTRQEMTRELLGKHVTYYWNPSPQERKRDIENVKQFLKENSLPKLPFYLQSADELTNSKK